MCSQIGMPAPRSTVCKGDQRERQVQHPKCAAVDSSSSTAGLTFGATLSKPKRWPPGPAGEVLDFIGEKYSLERDCPSTDEHSESEINAPETSFNASKPGRYSKKPCREARKNHHSSRSERGTEDAVLFYSLIESAKLAGVEPDAYLRTAARRYPRRAHAHRGRAPAGCGSAACELVCNSEESAG